ncbi:hypothetical protein CH379_017920 [Leptospira ellisii]|uniref:Uncharacterized protein n=1 Tax=Leptospira ellisii TaxID=2023197 RepID=A0A2N0BHP7_9LEPT|nr:hypothetical protein [Leptospira ellisii]MDV6237513.1 hypothetical protein [Leptospira ellisii]PJZ91045.1 hypothetical protein CH379_20875 [Leptospira ellisii]PKA03507.1 hypothetical protein CH375_16570 [Leptospira ellisii]
MISQDQINYIAGFIISGIGYFLKHLHSKLNEALQVSYEARNKVNQLERDLNYQATDLKEIKIELRTLGDSINRLNTTCSTLTVLLQDAKDANP